MGNSRAKEKANKDKIVLVVVLKSKRDLAILLSENWYRVPVARLPKRRFDYLAFYQTAVFGSQGKQILYFARVLSWQIAKRRDLLSNDLKHPKANDDYYCLLVGEIKKLPSPVKNIIPRRVFFGFTTLKQLLKSKNILQLYKVAPTEQILKAGLEEAGIKAVAQYYVSVGERRYFLDFAVFCKNGGIAIECDNTKAHSGKAQREKDKIKNNFLQQQGWVVIRLTESEIISDLTGCVAKIKKAAQKLAGIVD